MGYRAYDVQANSYYFTPFFTGDLMMTKWICMLTMLLCVHLAHADVIEIEAEDAKVDAANIVEVSEASGGKVVAFDKQTKQSSMEFTFEIPAEGKYQFWAVGRGLDGNSDSFFIKLDSEQREEWDVKWYNNKALIKQPVRYRKAMEDGKKKATPFVAVLTKGEHKLVVSRREAGAQLDKLIIAPADMKMDDKK
jgi:hypothetical protein